jgi:hypothetical protein
MSSDPGDGWEPNYKRGYPSAKLRFTEAGDGTRVTVIRLFGEAGQDFIGFYMTARDGKWAWFTAGRDGSADSEEACIVEILRKPAHCQEGGY